MDISKKMCFHPDFFFFFSMKSHLPLSMFFFLVYAHRITTTGGAETRRDSPLLASAMGALGRKNADAVSGLAQQIVRDGISCGMQ